VLTTSAAPSFALLPIEYALFTTAITVYVALPTDTLGAHAFDAAGERARGTFLGILVAALAFRIFGEAMRDTRAEPRDAYAVPSSNAGRGGR
jgi:uncharacterized membrane protein YccC